MQKLTPADLMSLEQYAKARPEFRAKVIAHKKNRRLALGDHAALYFEDRLTMQYQVQEMLRIERIFEEAGIQEELSVYNDLVPDGSNWKATFMVEYADETERKIALAKLVGIELAVWLKVGDFSVIRPIANEDLDRSSPDKTAAVHFMRFELTPAMVVAVKSGAEIQGGIDHPQYQCTVKVASNIRGALAQDLM
ncbi:MAG: DUF3501 family protein [Methylophilales bacterium]|nr:DUF3501 family protein [Methylophilales bacterium]